jgi:hypothetical protein
VRLFGLVIVALGSLALGYAGFANKTHEMVAGGITLVTGLILVVLSTRKQ